MAAAKAPARKTAPKVEANSSADPAPGHRRRQAAGRYPLPGDASTNNGDRLRLTQQLRRGIRHRRRGCLAVPSAVMALPVPPVAARPGAAVTARPAPASTQPQGGRCHLVISAAASTTP